MIDKRNTIGEVKKMLEPSLKLGSHQFIVRTFKHLRITYYYTCDQILVKRSKLHIMQNQINTASEY